MRRSSIVSISIVIFIIASTNIANVRCLFHPCKPCSSLAECDGRPPDVCIWGETRNYCNRRVCTKGPGEICGGPANYLGECGEGMMCKSDNRCHGCSIQTMTCYPTSFKDQYY